MAMALDAALYDLLTADKTGGTLYAKLGGRISTAYGDPGDDFPLMVFEQTGAEITHLFGNKLMHKAGYQIRIVDRWENGVAALADIADLAVGVCNGAVAETAPAGFDRAEFTVVNATDIDRADELMTATVNITVRATQTAGL